jgi:hypothetical protein
MSSVYLRVLREAYPLKYKKKKLGIFLCVIYVYVETFIEFDVACRNINSVAVYLESER